MTVGLMAWKCQTRDTASFYGCMGYKKSPSFEYCPIKYQFWFLIYYLYICIVLQDNKRSINRVSNKVDLQSIGSQLHRQLHYKYFWLYIFTYMARLQCQSFFFATSSTIFGNFFSVPIRHSPLCLRMAWVLWSPILLQILFHLSSWSILRSFPYGTLSVFDLSSV